MSQKPNIHSVEFDLPDICKICQENKYKYCCPRCNILYCSLNCYRSATHAECSESFYKDCIAEEITSRDHNPHSKKVMEEILTKMNETNNIEYNGDVNDTMCMDENDEFSDENDPLDSDDNDSVPDLALRIKNIDLDNSNAVWDVLTEEERKEFEQSLEKDITHILPKWEPWWNFHIVKKLVIEIDESKPRYNYEDDCPKTLNNVEDFTKLTMNPPAACLQYNMINVLSSYVYMARIFQGDHQSLYKEASYCLISLSTNLNNNGNFDNIESSIIAVIQESYNYPTFSINTEAQDQLKSDLKSLITGPEESNNNFYIQSSLSDIYNLLNKYKKNEINTKNSGSLKNKQFSNIFVSDMDNCMTIPREKIKKLIKKIEFYQSFNSTFGNEICINISNSVFFQSIKNDKS